MILNKKLIFPRQKKKNTFKRSFALHNINNKFCAGAYQRGIKSQV